MLFYRKSSGNVKLQQCYYIFLTSLNLTCTKVKRQLNLVMIQHVRDHFRKPSTLWVSVSGRFKYRKGLECYWLICISIHAFKMISPITKASFTALLNGDFQVALLIQLHWFLYKILFIKTPTIICKTYWRNCASWEKAVTTTETLTEYTMRSSPIIASNNCPL